MQRFQENRESQDCKRARGGHYEHDQLTKWTRRQARSSFAQDVSQSTIIWSFPIRHHCNYHTGMLYAPRGCIIFIHLFIYTCILLFRLIITWRSSTYMTTIPVQWSGGDRRRRHCAKTLTPTPRAFSTSRGYQETTKNRDCVNIYSCIKCNRFIVCTSEPRSLHFGRSDWKKIAEKPHSHSEFFQSLI